MSIVAVTPDGRIPLVRQYRPALEDYTWELPAGLVDPGEDAGRELPRANCWRKPASRAQAIHCARATARPAPGRLNNRIHAFYVETGEQVGEPEPGITTRLVTPRELVAHDRAGEFVSQLHLGSLMLAELHGLIDLPRLAARARRRAKPKAARTRKTRVK